MMMTVWRTGGKIIRTVSCCVVNDSCTECHEQFLKLSVGLRLRLVFVGFFGFNILCVFCFSLDCFVLIKILFAFVVFDLVSSVSYTTPTDWMWRTYLKWPVLCRAGRETLTKSTQHQQPHRDNDSALSVTFLTRRGYEVSRSCARIYNKRTCCLGQTPRYGHGLRSDTVISSDGFLSTRRWLSVTTLFMAYDPPVLSRGSMWK